MTTSTRPRPGTVDIDTHEMIPFHMWAEHFGEPVAAKLAWCETSPLFADNGANTSVRPDIVADDMAITPSVVARTKGASAPAAIDLRRRVEVMDAMGVERSLVFPSFGLVGLLMAGSPELAVQIMTPGIEPTEVRALGLEVIGAYNDWVERSIGELDPRVRPVAIMLTESVEQMLEQLRELIGHGVRAVWLPSGAPPAGTSPADPALDPVWQLAADHDVAVLLHIGTDFQFVASPAWAAGVDAFVPPKASAEFPISPYQGATAHLGAEHFITTMVLGGVFERVPRLRLGAIEIGAQWLGPLADRLDIWAGVFAKALDGVLSRSPSEYIASNVRVCPFYFEPIDEFFERYPHLQDCYCFASDYPHVEGGRDALATYTQRLGRLGPAITAKFLTNGAWLVPD